MKKVYLVLVAVLISATVFAQKVADVKTMNYVEKNSSALNHPMTLGAKATIDTAGWTSTYTPAFASPTAELHTYIMTSGTPSVAIGYWFGTNGTATSDSSSDIWAQCWTNFASIKVSGILFFVSGKANMSSSSSSKLRVWIQNMLPYAASAHGCVIGTSPTTFGPSPAGPVLSVGEMTISALDTAFLNFNYVPLTMTPVISGDFAACADFKAIRTNGDTAYMFCDAIGNGLGMNYSQNCVDTNTNYYVANNLSTLDVNQSIFAVIDDGAGVNDNGFFSGFKMTLRQNPARENLVIDYAIQYGATVKLTVWDIKGNEVVNMNEGSKDAGQHSMNVNIANLQAGTYFCSLSSSFGGRITKKLVIE